MMNNQEIRNSLNDVNIRLLDEIEKIIPVRFDEWDKNYYAGKISIKDGYGVVYCKPDMHQAKIAHELLHIKTGCLLGDNNIMLVKARQSRNPLSRMIITEELCEGLLNQTEHSLFFDDYMAMGYNAVDFFESMKLQVEADLWKDIIIKNGIGKGGAYSTTEVYSYLAVLILLLLYPVKGQYNHQYKKISKAIPELANAMERFVGSLQTISIASTDRNRMQSTYEALASDIIRWLDNSTVKPSFYS